MKFKSITSALLAGLLAVTSMVSLAGCGDNQSKSSSSKVEETTEAPKELSLPVSSDEALKKSYEDLYYMFEDAGFTNADCKDLEDLDSSSDKMNGVIKSVTVNGSEKFQKGDKMMSDVKIMINYHSVKKGSLPIDKYDLEEDDDAIYYEDAVTQFQKEGFKDISTRPFEDTSKEDGRVMDVTVDGKSSLSELMFSAPIDSKIVIVYYTKAVQSTTKAAPKTESESESKSSKTETKPNTDNGEVTPSFKEMMDSYEAFFDSYIDFMKKYKENPGDLNMLNEYSEYMSKYTDYMSKLSAVDKTTLSAADLAYYTEVHTRILKKIAEINE